MVFRSQNVLNGTRLAHKKTPQLNKKTPQLELAVEQVSVIFLSNLKLLDKSQNPGTLAFLKEQKSNLSIIINFLHFIPSQKKSVSSFTNNRINIQKFKGHYIEDTCFTTASTRIDRRNLYSGYASIPWKYQQRHLPFNCSTVIP